MKISIISFIILFSIIVVGLFSNNFYIHDVSAKIVWIDTFNSYEDITSYRYNVQNYTNTLSDKVIDVYVVFKGATNQTSLTLYSVSANGTNFVNIQEGIEVINNNTFYTLIPNSSISFDVILKQHQTDYSTVNMEITIQKYTIGDCNRDDIIDIYDAILVGTIFGESNVVYDMNRDGTIDVFDAILLGNHYGETS